MIFHVVPIQPNPQTPPILECFNETCGNRGQFEKMRGLTWFRRGKREDAAFCCYRCMLDTIPTAHLNQA